MFQGLRWEKVKEKMKQLTQLREQIQTLQEEKGKKYDLVQELLSCRDPSPTYIPYFFMNNILFFS